MTDQIGLISHLPEKCWFILRQVSKSTCSLGVVVFISLIMDDWLNRVGFSLPLRNSYMSEISPFKVFTDTIFLILEDTDALQSRCRVSCTATSTAELPRGSIYLQLQDNLNNCVNYGFRVVRAYCTQYPLKGTHLSEWQQYKIDIQRGASG